MRLMSRGVLTSVWSAISVATSVAAPGKHVRPAAAWPCHVRNSSNPSGVLKYTKRFAIRSPKACNGTTVK